MSTPALHGLCLDDTIGLNCEEKNALESVSRQFPPFFTSRSEQRHFGVRTALFKKHCQTLRELFSSSFLFFFLTLFFFLLSFSHTRYLLLSLSLPPLSLPLTFSTSHFSLSFSPPLSIPLSLLPSRLFLTLFFPLSFLVEDGFDVVKDTQDPPI